MEVVGLSNKGLKRSENQDYLLLNREYDLFIVADGMGGHELGEVASLLAANKVESVFEKEIEKGSPSLNALNKALKEANSFIYNYSENRLGSNNMGTTLTAATIKDNVAHIAHIGDSRAYMIGNSKMTTLTSDHSYVGELVRSGSIKKEDAINHPKRNILTRALGIESEIEFDVIEKSFKKNNCLLLCTDGLFNCVSEEYIYKTISNTFNLRESASLLIEEALNKGGTDNITVVIIRNT